MATSSSAAHLLTHFFPPTHTEPEDIEEDGRKVLEENEVYYRQYLQSHGGNWTVSMVNESNKKYSRMRSLDKNKKIVRESLQAGKEIMQAIEDIKKVQEVQDDLIRLQHTPHVSHMVFEHLQELMDHPGFAQPLSDYIHKATQDDVQARREEMDKLRSSIAKLKLPQKHHEILQLRRAVNEAQAKLNSLGTELEQSKTSYNTLSGFYHSARLELVNRASENINEVNEFKTKLVTLELKQQSTLEQMNLLKADQQTKERELQQRDTSIAQKDALIAKRDTEIDNERNKSEALHIKYEQLTKDYQELELQKLDEAGINRSTEKSYEDARQALVDLRKDLVDSREQYKQAREETRQLQASQNVMTEQVANLQESNQELLRDKHQRDLEIDQRQQEVQRKEADLNSANNLVNSLRQEHTALLDEISDNQTHARRNLRSVERSKEKEVIKIRKQLEDAKMEFDSVKAADDEKNEKLRAEVRDLHKQVNTLSYDKAHLQSDTVAQRRENERLFDSNQKLEDDLRQTERAKSGLESLVKDLSQDITASESGKSAGGKAPSTLMQRLALRDGDLSKERAKTQAAEERLRRCNEVIVKHAFGDMGGVVLDFEAVGMTLKSALAVTDADFQRASQSLLHLTTGLREQTPPAGFQLWVEAVLRPETFNSHLVRAYLHNAKSQGFADIGFLLLTVDALLDGPHDDLRGFKALAVYDILQLWMLLDPGNKNDVQSRLGKIKRIRPHVNMHDNSLPFIEKLLHCAEECLKEIIEPGAQGITSRGTRFSRYINGLSQTTNAILDMSNRGEKSRTSKDIKLVYLGSTPRYLLYINQGRIAWIEPENVTIRVDPMNGVWIVHDKLDPHFLAETRFPLEMVDVSMALSILAGATYLSV